MKQVQLITDGACHGNPGPGGWASILRYGKHTKEIFGSSSHTTNNRMELAAAIEGFRALKEPCGIEVVTDSEYVMKGITEWIEGWKRKGWVTKAKTPVVNRDLWMTLDRLRSGHKVRWTWTKGHASHRDNNRADELATLAAASQTFSKGYKPDVQFPTYDLRNAEPEAVDSLFGG
jgi:ribonuclease HI